MTSSQDLPETLLPANDSRESLLVSICRPMGSSIPLTYRKSTPPPPSHPLRSILLSFLDVSVCVRVRWPRTGSPIACRLPLYVPISFSLLMLSCIILRASFSMVMVDSSAVNDVIVFGGRDPTLASGWIEYLAIIRVDVAGPRA